MTSAIYAWNGSPGTWRETPTTRAYRIGYHIGYHLGWLLHGRRQG